jgi:hypothetical protein
MSPSFPGSFCAQHPDLLLCIDDLTGHLTGRMGEVEEIRFVDART